MPRAVRFQELLGRSVLLGLASYATAQPTVSATGETMRLKSSSVAASGSAWAITLTMNDDNGDATLGTSFRRWWHCQISGLRPAGETLHIKVDNAGYGLGP